MIKNYFSTTTLLALVMIAAGCASTRTQQAPGEVVDDRVVTVKVKSALIENPTTKAGQIDVETFRGIVQLNGFVDTAASKADAATVARKINGVKEVRNNLRLDTERSTVGEVIDDSVITAKVKAALIADPVTKARQINVETKEGVVQLSGFVDSSAEQNKATEVAHSVTGVRKVDNQIDVKQKA
jgi:hyperosmotically inducible periplasmic protein